MRLSVISLPHTSTTAAYSCCAYTMKCLKMASMMTARGHEVYLYGGPENEASCTEFISCITSEEQASFGFNGPQDYLSIDFNAPEPWSTFHNKVIEEMQKRIQPRDIICVITGHPTACLAEAFPNNIVVEAGVGYSGIYHNFAVFESIAWRNYVYGYNRMDGRFFDTVIPNYFEVKDFPWSQEVGDYYLFIGRLIPKKGLHIAQQVCEKLGKRLLVAGPGHFSGYGEYQGVVGPKERAELMSHAIATFSPSLYIEPFGGSHVESMLCGTPVITTDFGVYCETVTNGLNGWRCNMMSEFIAATRSAAEMTSRQRLAIRQQAQSLYATEVVAAQYELYFHRLQTLFGDGFYDQA